MSEQRTDHAAEAHEYEREACGAQRVGEESAEAMATLSLMKATLALAEQQRIANLIALANMNTDGKYWADDIADLASEAFTMVTSPEIREALGI